MIENNYNTVDLLEVLYRAISGVSKNTFTTSRPSSTDASMSDFVIVAFPVRIHSRGAYGETTCRISLYAHDTPNGENLPKLRTMQDEVYKRLPIVTDKCSITQPVPINAGKDNLGFHCIHIQCNVIIKHK